MIQVYAPSRVLLDRKGRALFVEPLKAVPAPTCDRWNDVLTRMECRK